MILGFWGIISKMWADRSQVDLVTNANHFTVSIVTLDKKHVYILMLHVC